MTSIKYSFVAVSLAVAASSVAEVVEVGYAPQTMVAAQQYSVNKANYMRGGALEAHVHVRADEENPSKGDSGSAGNAFPPGAEHLKELELSSSEIRDNAATSPSHFTLAAGSSSSVLTILLAAGSVWAAAF